MADADKLDVIVSAGTANVARPWTSALGSKERWAMDFTKAPEFKMSASAEQVEEWRQLGFDVRPVPAESKPKKKAADKATDKAEE